MRPITSIIIHCSDSPNDRHVTIKEIGDWHKARGWKKVGYHYVLRRDGVIEQGRVESEIGAHCQGHNTKSIGICLVGRDAFTASQLANLRTLILEIKQRHPKITDIFGHYELNPGKTCPNLDMKQIRDKLINSFMELLLEFKRDKKIVDT